MLARNWPTVDLLPVAPKCIVLAGVGTVPGTPGTIIAPSPMSVISVLEYRYTDIKPFGKINHIVSIDLTLWQEGC